MSGVSRDPGNPAFRFAHAGYGQLQLQEPPPPIRRGAFLAQGRAQVEALGATLSGTLFLVRRPRREAPLPVTGCSGASVPRGDSNPRPLA
jgi:hypothetical protein